mmetsp:Transcript_47815/g.63195  ORF Transcript_47815/g.63195 Transcript_47815/m.63195 type:complete len:104 (-) Transcript_47815:396-707(-)
MHCNRLWYNRELFAEQTKVLFITNIFFGTLSLIIICVGFTVINSPDAKCLLCYGGNMWIERGIFGTLFIMCHQILILMKINSSQMVLIRIPNNRGIFNPMTLY